MTRARNIIILVLLGVWAVYVGVQRGDDFDEAEHCHVAWMMGHLHQQPLQDFFQHHQPLLWDLLKTYYLLGNAGPEVMYFGRALVVVCTILFAVGLFLLGRNWAKADEGSAAPGLLGCVLGVAPLLLLSLTFRTVVVIRPETVGLPLFMFALVCWVRPAGKEGAARRAAAGRGLLTGVLFGAAVYASPRFVMLAGAFLLLPADRRRPFSLEIVPLGAAVLGAVAFAGGYQLFATGRLSDIRFNLEFTSLIYKIGETNFKVFTPLMVFAAEALSVAAWVLLRLDGPGRRRFLVQGAYLLLVTAASLGSAWPHLHPQNFLASAVWLGVMLTCAAGRLEVGRGAECPRPVCRWALAAAGVCALLTLKDVVGSETIVTKVEQKHVMLALLRPGDTVLLAAAFHPVSAPDATYYGNVIVDGEDRMRKTVELARQRRWDLPECDYLRDILDRKPALLDDYLLKVLSGNDLKVLREVLDRDYTPFQPFPASHHCFRRKESPTVAQSAGAEAVSGEVAPASRAR